MTGRVAVTKRFPTAFLPLHKDRALVNFPGSETKIQAREDLKMQQLPTFSISTAKPLAKCSGFEIGSDDDEFPTTNGHKKKCMNQHEDNFMPTCASRQPPTQSDIKTIVKRDAFKTKCSSKDLFDQEHYVFDYK